MEVLSMKKILSVILSFIMVISLSATALADNGSQNNIGVGQGQEEHFSGDTYFLGDTTHVPLIEINEPDFDIILEEARMQMIPHFHDIDGSLIEYDESIRHFHLLPHTHSIKDTKKALFNLFHPLTPYVAARDRDAEVTYSAGQSHTISSSISTSVGVEASVVSASIGAEVTGSVTYSASTTVKYPVKQGEAGRIILRYSQDYYTFTCITRWTLTGNEDTGSGNAYSKPFNAMYDYQWYKL
jgi:hypothetical protein